MLKVGCSSNVHWTFNEHSLSKKKNSPNIFVGKKVTIAIYHIFSGFLWMVNVDIIKYNILQYFHFFVPQKDLISNMGLIFCITSVCDIKLVYISPLENVPISVSTNLLPKMAEDRYSVSFSSGKWWGGNEVYSESNYVSLEFMLQIVGFFEYFHFFHKKWLINIYPTSEKYTSLKKVPQ